MSNQHLLDQIRPFLDRGSAEPPWRAGDVVIRAGSETCAPAIWRIVADVAWTHDRLPAVPGARTDPGLYGLVQPFSGRDVGVQLERVLDDRGQLPERQWIVRIPEALDDSEYIHSDLLSFRPSEDLQRAVHARSMTPQKIEDGWGQVSFDRYPVLITRLPTGVPGVTSAETLLEHVRLNFNTFIDTSIATFTPYDAAIDGPVWTSASPVGAVLHIAMADDGSILCAERTSSYWRAVTVNSPRDGWHPVSGAREWGVQAVDGGFELYTRAADRTTNAYHGAVFPLAYMGADRLWTSLQDKVARFVNSHGGTAMVRTPMTDWQWWYSVSGSYHPTVRWVI